MGLIHSPIGPSDGLVLCLDTANRRSYPGSGTNWLDLSGNGNHGVLTNGPTLNTGPSGGMNFDGSDDYISFPTTAFPVGNSPITISVFFRWLGNGVNTWNIIFGYGQDIGQHKCPLIIVDENKIQFNFGSLQGNVKSNTTILTNVWYHVVGRYDLSKTQIFVNGLLENSTNYSSANISRIRSTDNTPIGSLGALFSAYGNIGTGATQRYGTFNGQINDIKIYNRAISDFEIRTLYEIKKRRFQ